MVIKPVLFVVVGCFFLFFFVFVFFCFVFLNQSFINRCCSKYVFLSFVSGLFLRMHCFSETPRLQSRARTPALVSEKCLRSLHQCGMVSTLTIKM